MYVYVCTNTKYKYSNNVKKNFVTFGHKAKIDHVFERMSVAITTKDNIRTVKQTNRGDCTM